MTFLSISLFLIFAATQTDAVDDQVPEGGFDIPDSIVQFIQEIDVPALASGKLTEVNVKDFQTIEADVVLARIDDTALKDRQQAAEVGRQLLSNKLQSNLLDQIAKLSMDEAKAKHDSNVSTNASSPGSIPTMEIHRSMLALERSKIEAQRVKEQKEDLRLELSIQSSEVAQVQHQIEQLKVISPVRGVVLKVNKQAGEWVNVGETVASVARMDRLQIPVLLSETQVLHRYAAGTSVVVHWREGNTRHSLRGRIASVEPVLRGNDDYRGMVEVENRKLSSGWLLMAGRRVTVTIYPSTSPKPNDSPATARLLNGAPPHHSPAIVRPLNERPVIR